MKIIVLGNRESRSQFLGNVQSNDIEYLNDIADLPNHSPVDLLVDLDFQPHTERMEALKNSNASIIAINDVLQSVPAEWQWLRFNGWPGFTGNAAIEIAGDPKKQTDECIEGFRLLGKIVKWVPDVPGFISPRILSMIINEAFFALEENVSSREEIDTAMKLGTNYPYGPFEWADMIGRKNILTLLEKLSKENPRYQPAPGLYK